MALRSTIRILLATLMLTSCEEESGIKLLTKQTALVAVEAIVTNENINHVIRLSLPYQQLNGKSLPVIGAQVSISDGTSIVQLVNADSGKYITPKMRFLSGIDYQLTIEYGGKQYSAKDRSVAVEALPPLAYLSSGSEYEFVFTEYGKQANYIEHILDWSGTASCGSSLCKAKIIYYDLKSVDSNEIFKPAKSDFRFPSQSTIIRRKFSVSSQYRDFLRSMLSETEWRGGVFDVQRDNASTNLTEGAIGFFAVCTVVSDTVKIP